MAHHSTRSDGWTPERQLSFLTALTVTRNATAAARAVGMSRESAHRLRNRPGNALFAHLWDLAIAAAPAVSNKGHTHPLTDGQIARSLGTHFRRESGDFDAIGRPRASRPTGDPTWTL